MAKDTPPRKSQDELALEIDKLLKKLPGADPMLRGDPEPVVARPAAARSAGVGVVGTGPRPATPPQPSVRAQKAGVWVRTLLGVGVGVAVTQWPYARSCGWPLYGYLGVVGAVIVAGGWAGVWSWRLRMAVTHVVSLILVFWGIVLAAEQILPRIGYAAETAEWRCAK